jgi:hypothetical protein
MLCGTPAASHEEEPGVKYMLLIYGSEESQPRTEEAVKRVMDEYWAYEKAVADAGVMLGSDAL